MSEPAIIEKTVAIPPPGKIQGRPGFRLPHKSMWQAEYDAIEQLWTIVLTADGETLAMKFPSVHPGMRKLSRQWEKKWKEKMALRKKEE